MPLCYIFFYYIYIPTTCRFEIKWYEMNLNIPIKMLKLEDSSSRLIHLGLEIETWLLTKVQWSLASQILTYLIQEQCYAAPIIQIYFQGVLRRLLNFCQILDSNSLSPAETVLHTPYNWRWSCRNGESLFALLRPVRRNPFLTGKNFPSISCFQCISGYSLKMNSPCCICQ